jgi:hypothetical protein
MIINRSDLKLAQLLGQESILPNLDFFVFPIFVVKLEYYCIRKYCMYFKMTKLESKTQKKYSFYEENSLIGLTLGCKNYNFVNSGRRI